MSEYEKDFRELMRVEGEVTIKFENPSLAEHVLSAREMLCEFVQTGLWVEAEGSGDGISVWFKLEPESVVITKDAFGEPDPYKAVWLSKAQARSIVDVLAKVLNDENEE